MDNQTVTQKEHGLMGRAKAILTSPSSEWPKVAAETDSPMQVFTTYVVPLAAIGPVASFIGGQLFGYNALGFSYKPTLMNGLTTLVTSYVLALLSVWLVAWIANFLSPKFGGKDSFPSAFRLVAYAMTASMLAGIFGLLPALSILGILGLYSLYLFYKGATPVMGVPADKTLAYTAVTVLAAIVLSLIVGAISAAVAGPSMIAAADAQDDMSFDMGAMGNIQSNSDGSTMTITGPDGEEMTITVDNE